LEGAPFRSRRRPDLADEVAALLLSEQEVDDLVRGLGFFRLALAARHEHGDVDEVTAREPRASPGASGTDAGAARHSGDRALEGEPWTAARDEARDGTRGRRRHAIRDGVRLPRGRPDRKAARSALVRVGLEGQPIVELFTEPARSLH